MTISFLKSIDLQPFIPKIVTTFKEGYTKRLFLCDLLAGITVGIIALPLAMAFAIGSGLSPEKGLFCAIIAGFLTSLLGGTSVMVSGPTGAFVVIIFGIVQKFGYDGLVIVTLIAAFLLLLMGLTKCGRFLRFIPYPVVMGFTTGIATVLFTAQIKDFFGYAIPQPASTFLDRVVQYWTYSHTCQLAPFCIALMTLLLILVFRKISKKIPGAVIALFLATFITSFFELPLATIESVYGAIPQSLPSPSFPSFSVHAIQDLFPDAITVAFLVAIESLLCAVISDGMTGLRFKPNCELVAQGFANLGSIIFGGLPSTGAIARTTANIQMQAKTPVAGMIHAITLFLCMVFFAPLIGKIPLAALSSILIVVALNMSEFHHFIEVLKGPKSDALVLASTFLLTVLIDLTVAVQIGIVLSAFSFLKHMSDKTTLKAFQLIQKEDEEPTPEKDFREQLQHIPKDIEVFDLEGPFFFSVTGILEEALRLCETKPRAFILRMRDVPLIDMSGMYALQQFALLCKKQGIQLFIVEVRSDVLRTLVQSGKMKSIGTSHFKKSLDVALQAVT